MRKIIILIAILLSLNQSQNLKAYEIPEYQISTQIILLVDKALAYQYLLLAVELEKLFKAHGLDVTFGTDVGTHGEHHIFINITKEINGAEAYVQILLRPDTLNYLEVSFDYFSSTENVKAFTPAFVLAHIKQGLKNIEKKIIK